MDSFVIHEKFTALPEGEAYDGTKGSKSFSKEVLRKALSENLREIRKDEDAKVKVNKVSIYKELNEKYFANKSALHFCQLSYLDNFIQKSTI
jgi:hypothetical protein